jgi:hypothetical protein
VQHESSVTSTGVTVGAATTITELEQILRSTGSENAEAATVSGAIGGRNVIAISGRALCLWRIIC